MAKKQEVRHIERWVEAESDPHRKAILQAHHNKIFGKLGNKKLLGADEIEQIIADAKTQG